MVLSELLSLIELREPVLQRHLDRAANHIDNKSRGRAVPLINELEDAVYIVRVVVNAALEQR